MDCKSGGLLPFPRTGCVPNARVMVAQNDVEGSTREKRKEVSEKATWSFRMNRRPTGSNPFHPSRRPLAAILPLFPRRV